MTVKRLHEVSFPLQISGSFLFFRGNCCISHRTYCQETPGAICWGGGKQNSLSGEGLLDHTLMITNKDLIDILYSSNECQTFCISLSLFTDQKIQKVIAPFSPVNSGRSCLKCYRSIHAKTLALSHIRRS